MTNVALFIGYFVMAFCAFGIIAVIVWFMVLRAKTIWNRYKVPYIHKCANIWEIVKAIDYERVCPYSVGMSLKRVKRIMGRLYSDTTQIENTLQIYNLSGVAPCITLPYYPSDLIEDVVLLFSKGMRVNTISVGIKDFEQNKDGLMWQMQITFGKPVSEDAHYVFWRNGDREIRLELNEHRLSVTNLGYLIGKYDA